MQCKGLIIILIPSCIYVCVHMCVLYIYIRYIKKKIEYHEKGQHFLSLISESETHILYRFITHRVKYFKPLLLTFFMIMAYR